MTTSPVSKRRRIWPWIVAAIMAPWLLLAAGVWSVITPIRELTIIRDELVTDASGPWKTRVQVDLGPATLTVARTAMAFVRNKDIEIPRNVLAAVKRASVGVYFRDTDNAVQDPAALVESAETALLARGWERMVKVLDGDQAVLIFNANDMRRAGEFCVAVMQDEECVLVYAKLAPDELSTLVNVVKTAAMRHRKA